MTIVETRAITGGVDTHADVHVAAALDPVGGLLGVQEFPASPAGYAQLLGWLRGFGTVCLVGIEGTGSYGAGLTRPASMNHSDPQLSDTPTPFGGLRARPASSGSDLPWRRRSWRSARPASTTRTPAAVTCRVSPAP